jgi:hypothetical protein
MSAAKLVENASALPTTTARITDVVFFMTFSFVATEFRRLDGRTLVRCLKEGHATVAAPGIRSECGDGIIARGGAADNPVQRKGKAPRSG